MKKEVISLPDGQKPVNNGNSSISIQYSFFEEEEKGILNILIHIKVQAMGGNYFEAQINY